MADGKGRTALITGATDGVGRVVAKELGRQGWRVLVHGRDRTRGDTLVREIQQAGARQRSCRRICRRLPRCAAWPMPSRRRPTGSGS
jgi:NAD(P)-dependent dehydrogenase (short-subunit alcohol dehydrogenase family)